MKHFIFATCYFMWCPRTLIALHIMLIIGYIKVELSSKFLLVLYIKLSVWRRLGERLIRLGDWKGVARLASPYRL